LWIKSYVLNLFIVIILANLLGLILDIIIYPFPGLGQYLQSPTGNVYFTGALAGVSMLIVLIVEAKSKGF
jgi:F0F1-type ATP synthase membrane subunit a